MCYVPKTSQQKPSPTGVRLPATLKTTLEELASEREMNLSEFIRYTAMFYVDYTRQA